jgi:flagellar basal-body rod protein FlgC
MQALAISRTGLDVEWRRLEIISENLANINSAGNGESPLYRERHLVTGPRAFFSSYLRASMSPEGVDTRLLTGVDVHGVQESAAPPRLVHEPGNPLADAQGMVSYPNVDHASQMLAMIKASRAYEANLAAMSAARQMYAKALELGRR